MSTVAPAPAAQMANVVLLVEENHSYDESVGTEAMAYLNTLIAQYGLATEYYANKHPSIGNYFELTTGQTVTTDDAFSGPVTAGLMRVSLLISPMEEVT
jgi:hypothetical protein